MSSFAAYTQSNPKNVLRTALVGLKPADEIVLKGYLRVLLHLDVDLEWVLATDPQVDLFLIDSELRHAASIEHLQNQQHKPVLYVSRTEAMAGVIVNDKIMLPLRQLDELKSWLIKSVSILTQKPVISDKTGYQDETWVDDMLSTHQTPSPFSEVVTLNSEHTANSNHAAAPSFNTHFRSEDYKNIISVIKTLQQRPLGLYQIVVGQQVLAIIEPKHSRAWCLQGFENGPLSTLTLGWQLQPYNHERPEDIEAEDLIQWLWQCAWQQSELLLPLVNDDTSYQLRYWIKPVVQKHTTNNSMVGMIGEGRRELLQVMTALESAPCDVNQLAGLDGISIKTAKKIIASLLFSGSLQTENYYQLDTLIDHSHLEANKHRPSIITSSNTATSANNTSANNIADESATSTMSNKKHNTFDALLDRRARGEPAKGATSSTIFAARSINNSATSKSSSQKLTSAQQEKRGFLSKLRRKLGL